MSDPRTDDRDAAAPAGGGGGSAYDRLIGLLEAGGARYRLIDHEPEGRTDLVSAMRGNDPAQAAKCIVVMVKLDKKTRRHVLAVVPGDRRVDLGAVKRLLGGGYAGFASAETAERLAGSVSGTILPFSFHPDLELVADPALLEHAEIFFNAARLDRSMALDTADYRRLARPRLAAIAQPPAAPAAGSANGSAGGSAGGPAGGSRDGQRA
ncbi:YbaK/EbsC family protein [Actinomadura keratinilytica]|uniref:YbaK/aminoacyl-tRNA synthetase-associated domain-containing protein n=1 Tax=Actinomadura keratinilytica TaxID=547461 RepID=A0ABP7YFW4_9ACTN